MKLFGKLSIPKMNSATAWALETCSVNQCRNTLLVKPPLFDLANTVLQSRLEPQTATFQEKAFQVHNSIKESDSVHVNFHGRLWAWLDALNLCSLSR